MMWARASIFPLLTSALSVLAVSVALAASLPTDEKITSFYSDRAKEALIGEKFLKCDGSTVRWGQSSTFSEVTTIPCKDGHPSGMTPAATLLLHSDPFAACVLRCNRIHERICAPPPNDLNCGSKKRECLAACDTLLQPPPPPITR